MQVPTDGPDSEVQRDDSLSSSPCEFMLRLDQDLQDLGFPGLYEKEAAPASRKRKKLEKTSKEKTKAENRAANTLRYHTHPLKCHVCAGNRYSDQLEAELPDWLKDIDLGDSEMEELVCVCLGSCCVLVCALKADWADTHPPWVLEVLICAACKAQKAQAQPTLINLHKQNKWYI
jgi:hypothetical protein